MKGILFTEILFNKTVTKEKTMTRREGSLKEINDNPDDWEYTGEHRLVEQGVGMLDSSHSFLHVGSISNFKFLKSRHHVGEVVYIKEPVTTLSDGSFAYKYDLSFTDYNFVNQSTGEEHKWGNKMFMGADKARYYIRITDVKVERLFDISDEDCIKEGVDKHHSISDKFINYLYPERGGFIIHKKTGDVGFRKNKKGKWLLSAHCENPQESFFSLFRFANKIPKSREIKNIWCFVYSYELCDKEGNKI